MHTLAHRPFKEIIFFVGKKAYFTGFSKGNWKWTVGELIYQSDDEHVWKTQSHYSSSFGGLSGSPILSEDDKVLGVTVRGSHKPFLKKKNSNFFSSKIKQIKNWIHSKSASHENHVENEEDSKVVISVSIRIVMKMLDHYASTSYQNISSLVDAELHSFQSLPLWFYLTPPNDGKLYFNACMQVQGSPRFCRSFSENFSQLPITIFVEVARSFNGRGYVKKEKIKKTIVSVHKKHLREEKNDVVYAYKKAFNDGDFKELAKISSYAIWLEATHFGTENLKLETRYKRVSKEIWEYFWFTKHMLTTHRYTLAKARDHVRSESVYKSPIEKVLEVQQETGQYTVSQSDENNLKIAQETDQDTVSQSDESEKFTCNYWRNLLSPEGIVACDSGNVDESLEEEKDLEEEKEKEYDELSYYGEWSGKVGDARNTFHNVLLLSSDSFFKKETF